MNKETIIVTLEDIETSFGYVLSSLTNYQQLDLSVRVNTVIIDIAKLIKSILQGKPYIDIRDVLELEKQCSELTNKLPKIDGTIIPVGHRIACLFFQIESKIKLLLLGIDNTSNIEDDYIRYINALQTFARSAGRYTNKVMLIDETII